VKEGKSTEIERLSNHYKSLFVLPDIGCHVIIVQNSLMHAASQRHVALQFTVLQQSDFALY